MKTPPFKTPREQTRPDPRTPVALPFVIFALVLLASMECFAQQETGTLFLNVKELTNNVRTCSSGQVKWEIMAPPTSSSLGGKFADYTSRCEEYKALGGRYVLSVAYGATARDLKCTIKDVPVPSTGSYLVRFSWCTGTTSFVAKQSTCKGLRKTSGGFDAYTGGQCIDADMRIYMDQCREGVNAVNKAYCADDTVCAYEPVDCNPGDRCTAGKCVKSIAPSTPKCTGLKCSNSDAWTNDEIHTASSCQTTCAVPANVVTDYLPKTVKDVCKDGVSVLEAVCKDDECVQEEAACPAGQACREDWTQTAKCVCDPPILCEGKKIWRIEPCTADPQNCCRTLVRDCATPCADCGPDTISFEGMSISCEQCKNQPATATTTTTTTTLAAGVCGYLKIIKYDDQNSNGIRNAVEPFLSGFSFQASAGSSTLSFAPTNSSGESFSACIPLGTYEVSEIQIPSGWIASSGKKRVTITAADTRQNPRVLEFGNYRQKEVVKECGFLRILKFNDTDADGDRDSGENLMAGFKFRVAGNGIALDLVTGSEGMATSSCIPVGNYEATEMDIPAGWVSTAVEVTDEIKELQERHPGELTNVLIPPRKTIYVSSGNTQQSPAVLFFGNRKKEEATCGFLKVVKFNDLDSNGVHDAREPVLSGFTFQAVSGSSIMTLAPTDEKGEAYTPCIPVGSFTVSEKGVTGWVSTSGEGSVMITAADTEKNPKVLWLGNHMQTAAIHVLVFEDLDVDGVWDKDKEPKYDVKNLHVWLWNNMEKGTLVHDISEDMTAGEYLLSDSVQIDRYSITLGVWPRKAVPGFLCTTCKGQSFSIDVSPELGETKEVLFGISKTPSGDLKILKFSDSNGNGVQDAGESTLKGFKFNITRTESRQVYSETTDEYGIGMLEGIPVGDYTVEEVDVPAEYASTTPRKVTGVKITDGQETSLVFGNRKIKGTLTILKRDVKGNTLSGFRFDISHGGYTIFDGVLVDDAGKIVKEDLELGKYKITERYREGWEVLGKSTQEIELTPGKPSATVTFKNREKIEGTGYIRITKYEDANGNGIFDKGETPLPGFTFNVFMDTGFEDASDILDEEEYYFIMSNRDGVAFNMNEIPAGYYVISEVPQSGWIPSPDRGKDSTQKVIFDDSKNPVLIEEIKVEDGDTVNVFFGNKRPEEGGVDVPVPEECFGLIIKKLVNVGGKPSTEVGGWSFDVTLPDGSRDTKTTDANGEIRVCSGAGTYSATEEAKDGWTISPSGTQTGEVAEKETQIMTFTNEKWESATLIINKTVVADKPEDKKLSGWVFDITGPDGFKDTKTTDATGLITISSLKPGKYTIKEQLPPVVPGVPGWSVIPSEEQTVEVADKKTVTVHYVNSRDKECMDECKDIGFDYGRCTGECTRSSDEFFGDVGKKVDVAVLIDTSGSMTDEWTQMPAYLDTLKSDLSKKGVDLQYTLYELGCDGSVRIATGKPLRYSLLYNTVLDACDETATSGCGYSCGGSCGLVLKETCAADQRCVPKFSPTPPFVGCFCALDSTCTMPQNNLEEAADSGMENWGPALTWAAWGDALPVTSLPTGAFKHSWRAGARRILVPISDECPVGGNPCTPDDVKSMTEAIESAKENKVSIYPVIGENGDVTDLIAMTQQAALATDGRLHRFGAAWNGKPTPLKAALEALFGEAFLENAGCPSDKKCCCGFACPDSNKPSTATSYCRLNNYGVCRSGTGGAQCNSNNEFYQPLGDAYCSILDSSKGSCCCGGTATLNEFTEKSAKCDLKISSSLASCTSSGLSLEVTVENKGPACYLRLQAVSADRVLYEYPGKLLPIGDISKGHLIATGGSEEITLEISDTSAIRNYYELVLMGRSEELYGEYLELDRGRICCAIAGCSPGGNTICAADAQCDGRKVGDSWDAGSCDDSCRFIQRGIYFLPDVSDTEGVAGTDDSITLKFQALNLNTGSSIEFINSDGNLLPYSNSGLLIKSQDDDLEVVYKCPTDKAGFRQVTVSVTDIEQVYSSTVRVACEENKVKAVPVLTYLDPPASDARGVLASPDDWILLKFNAKDFPVGSGIVYYNPDGMLKLEGRPEPLIESMNYNFEAAYSCLQAGTAEVIVAVSSPDGVSRTVKVDCLDNSLGTAKCDALATPGVCCPAGTSCKVGQALIGAVDCATNCCNNINNCQPPAKNDMQMVFIPVGYDSQAELQDFKDYVGKIKSYWIEKTPLTECSDADSRVATYTIDNCAGVKDLVTTCQLDAALGVMERCALDAGYSDYNIKVQGLFNGVIADKCGTTLGLGSYGGRSSVASAKTHGVQYGGDYCGNPLADESPAISVHELGHNMLLCSGGHCSSDLGHCSKNSCIMWYTAKPVSINARATKDPRTGKPVGCVADNVRWASQDFCSDCYAFLKGYMLSKGYLTGCI